MSSFNKISKRLASAAFNFDISSRGPSHVTSSHKEREKTNSTIAFADRERRVSKTKSKNYADVIHGWTLRETCSRDRFSAPPATNCLEGHVASSPGGNRLNTHRREAFSSTNTNFRQRGPSRAQHRSNPYQVPCTAMLAGSTNGWGFRPVTPKGVCKALSAV